MRSTLSFLSLIAAAAALVACGQKGDLVRPEAAPASKSAAAAAAPAPTAVANAARTR